MYKIIHVFINVDKNLVLQWKFKNVKNIQFD